METHAGKSLFAMQEGAKTDSVKTQEEIRIRIIGYTGKIARLRREIDAGKYSHGILRYKAQELSQLKHERGILEWVLGEEGKSR